MPLTDADRAAIRDGELRLLDPTVRGSASSLAALLAEGFTEIGASGRRYTRADIIAALAQEPPGYQAELTDLEIEELAPNLALTHYRTEAHDAATTEPRRALRSSIWRRGPDGWQMLHHQGTKTNST